MWYAVEPGNIVTRNMLVAEQVQRLVEEEEEDGEEESTRSGWTTSFDDVCQGLTRPSAMAPRCISRLC